MLRIVGLLPRCSAERKAEYKKRPIIERYFSSGKHSQLLATHRYLNIFKVSPHVAMSMMFYLVTALAHLQADDCVPMRHIRIKLPEVKGARPEQAAEQQVDLGIIVALVLYELRTVQRVP